MRIRVTVFLRPVTVKILLARKDRQWGGQKWMAGQLGVSASHLSNMLAGRYPVPSGRQTVIIGLFRGMSHKKGGRLIWDDLFQQTVREDEGD